MKKILIAILVLSLLFPIGFSHSLADEGDQGPRVVATYNIPEEISKNNLFLVDDGARFFYVVRDFSNNQTRADFCFYDYVYGKSEIAFSRESIVSDINVSDKYITWSDKNDKVHFGWDIWGYDRETKESFVISGTDNPETTSRIAGDYCTFQIEYNNRSKELYLFSFKDKAKKLILGKAKKDRGYGICSLSERYIVWEDKRNGNVDIFAYDIEKGKEFAVCTDMSDQRYPMIDGDYIAWIDHRNDYGDALGRDLGDFFGYKLSEKRELRLDTSDTSIELPLFELCDGVLCYSFENHMGAGRIGTAIMVDMRQEKTKRQKLTEHDAEEPYGHGPFFRVNDKWIVWEEHKKDSETGSDVYGLSLSDGKRFPVLIGEGNYAPISMARDACLMRKIFGITMEGGLTVAVLATGK